MTTTTLSSPSRPAGPRSYPLIGNLFSFHRDPLGFLSRCARDYGDICQMRIGPYTIYLIDNAEYIEQVLVTQHRNFAKTPGDGPSRLLFGNGLLTSDGEFWLRQRRLAQPAFHRQRIAAYASTMVSATERLIAGWQPNDIRDIHQEMMRLTLDIVVRTLFAATLDEDTRPIEHALEVLMHELARRIGSPFQIPLRIPTPGNRRFIATIARLDQVIYAIIQQRRASRHEGDDLLSMLLHAQDEDGSRMSDKQLRDEVMTLFLAGHETTALALSWAWYLIAQHSEVETKLAAEWRSVLGGRHPTVADVPQLRYTEMVIKEAMRLYPPAWLVDAREARSACELGGYQLPAGAYVGMSQWVTHRNPRYFADPERFNPDRWTPEFTRDLPKFAYFPFGGGPRLCIGHAFAMMEAVLILATIGQQFRLKLVADHPVAIMPSISLRPKHGIRIALEQRG